MHAAEVGVAERVTLCTTRADEEGLVSKRADRPYRAGRSKDWVKVKNRKRSAYRRVQDQF